MTLRARLTAAFLAVVLGPVLLGAAFVGGAVPTIGAERARERLDLAASAVQADLVARCDRLTSAAAFTALLVVDQNRVRGSDVALTRPIEVGLADTIVLTASDGTVRATAGATQPSTWADCASPSPMGATAIGARAQWFDSAGTPLGFVIALASVDDALTHDLARVGGASVTVISAAGTPLSTEPGPEARRVSDAVDTRDGLTSTGRYVRRLDPQPGQPLLLALTVDPPSTSRLVAILVLVVAFAGILAIAAAWSLARSTTRPLADLAHAAERVAAGDLAARVPVRTADEVGRLGATFNRMTHEMRVYVRALTASRDQLRGYLALLGDTLSSTHDFGRILHVTLHTARAAAAAQAGVVLLYDPTTRLFVAQCAVGGLPGADLGGLRLKSGEGLLGAIAESGLPRRGVFAEDTLTAADEPRATTYVAVPFAAPSSGDDEDVSRGLLVLYDRAGPEQFDEADLITLTTFAAQAAVALDNVRLHEEAQRLSLTDPLTGLFNYRYLRESLRRELERASRFGRTLALLALDLDHFKDVNDTYGHGAGDVVLAELARRIRGLTREVDFAFRRGGEEFVILLPETDATGGAALARRLCAAVRRNPILTKDHAITVTVSIGIAVHPDHGSTGAALLEAADVALYAAKAAGRNRCRTADRAIGEDVCRSADRPLSPTTENWVEEHVNEGRQWLAGPDGQAAALASRPGASRPTEPTRSARGS